MRATWPGGQVGNGGRVEGNKRDCPQDGRAVDR